MPHGITQCYLPPGRGDIPALTPAEAGTRLSDPNVMHRLVGKDLSKKPVYSLLRTLTAGTARIQSIFPVSWAHSSKPAAAAHAETDGRTDSANKHLYIG